MSRNYINFNSQDWKFGSPQRRRLKRYKTFRKSNIPLPAGGIRRGEEGGSYSGWLITEKQPHFLDRESIPDWMYLIVTSEVIALDKLTFEIYSKDTGRTEPTVPTRYQ